MLLKVGLQFESEEEKVARFVSGLRRDIQDLVELYEYSSLDKMEAWFGTVKGLENR